jgi:hypothetical protein
MPGVPRELIEHCLNVDPKATPKRQHLRCFADDRWDAMKKELAVVASPPAAASARLRPAPLDRDPAGQIQYRRPA